MQISRSLQPFSASPRAVVPQFGAKSASAKISVGQTIAAKQQALLNQELFHHEGFPYTGRDIFQALKQAVSRRRKNPLLWLFRPLALMSQDLNPNYASTSQVVDKLDYYGKREDFTPKVQKALEALRDAKLLQEGSMGDWLGMHARDSAWRPLPVKKA